MKMNPRYWKTLERHPLSAEYADIKGRSFQRMVEIIKESGIANRRPVTLHDGQVLDGYQMYRACIEADVKPEFQSLPKGWEPETYIEAMNDVRRHESAELMEKRAEARRERVAAARAKGQSTRAIAEAEGVSQKTILNDLERSTDEGSSVEPPGGKVVGKDGKKRDATRNGQPDEPGDAYEGELLCQRCRRVGATKDCEKCKKLRKQAAQRKKRKGPKPGSVKWDWKPFERDFGNVVRAIPALGKAFGAPLKTPQAAGLTRLLDEFLKGFKAWHKELAKAAKA